MPDFAKPFATPVAASGTAGRVAGDSASALLRRLEWTAIRRLDGLLQGNTRTLMRGAGVDLADLREYQPHDDVRHIDWNVTARVNAPHVRVYSEDRDLVAWFLLDLSASVAFGAPGRAKRDSLTQFVALLARLIQRHGNRVGAVLHTGNHAQNRVLPARASRGHILHLLHVLLGQENPNANPQPARAGAAAKAVAKSAAKYSGTTALAGLLASAQAVLRRRSAVFVVSDFLSTPGWERPLAQLAQRHDVVTVRLFDPLELALPDVGLIHLRDPETGDTLLVDTQDRRFRQRYAALAGQREAALRANLARAGVDTLELASDDDLTEAVLRFVHLRGLRVRSARAAVRPGPARHAAA